MFQGAIAASEASCRACHAPFAELVTLAGTFINDFNTGGAQTRARARPKVPTEHKAPALRARLGLADGPPGLGRGATPAPHTLVDLGKPAPLTAPGAPFLALGRPEAARTTCPDASGRSGASWAAWRGRASTARAGASENMEGSTRAPEPAPRRRPRVQPGTSPARHHRSSTHPAPSWRIQTTGTPSRNHSFHPSPASTACIMAGLSARGRPGCWACRLFGKNGSETPSGGPRRPRRGGVVQGALR